MVGMMLLDQAQAAGLVVLSKGDKLVVKGPKAAEPLVRELLAHKVEVIDALVETAKVPGWSSWLETRADGSTVYVEQRDDAQVVSWEDGLPWL